MVSTKSNLLDHVLHAQINVADVMIALNVFNVTKITSYIMECADLTVQMGILRMMENVYLAIPKIALHVLLMEKLVLNVTDL
jgi:hypothetical protein